MKQLNEYLQRTVGSIITEAVRSRDIQRAMQLIANHLKKSKINMLPEIRPISVGSQRKLGVVYWTANNEAACFIWDLGMASQIEEVLFTKDFNAMNVAWSLGEDFVWDLEIQAKGANTIQMMLLAEKILTGKVAMTVAAAYKEIEDDVNKVIKRLAENAVKLQKDAGIYESANAAIEGEIGNLKVDIFK